MAASRSWNHHEVLWMEGMLACTSKPTLYRRQPGAKASRTGNSNLPAVSRAWKNNPTQSGLKPRELDRPG